MHTCCDGASHFVFQLMVIVVVIYYIGQITNESLLLVQLDKLIINVWEVIESTLSVKIPN